jgi:hypothetical protein
MKTYTAYAGWIGGENDRAALESLGVKLIWNRRTSADDAKFPTVMDRLTKSGGSTFSPFQDAGIWEPGKDDDIPF